MTIKRSSVQAPESLFDPRTRGVARRSGTRRRGAFPRLSARSAPDTAVRQRSHLWRRDERRKRSFDDRGRPRGRRDEGPLPGGLAGSTGRPGTVADVRLHAGVHGVTAVDGVLDPSFGENLGEDAERVVHQETLLSSKQPQGSRPLVEGERARVVARWPCRVGKGLEQSPASSETLLQGQGLVLAGNPSVRGLLVRADSCEVAPILVRGRHGRRAASGPVRC